MVDMNYTYPFTGIRPGWNRCPVCGCTMDRKGETLKHRPSQKQCHDRVIERKREIAEREVK